MENFIKDYGVPRSTLGRILQNKEEIQAKCSEEQGKLKRKRLSEYPELENCLSKWLR